jgi:hypothetical protein
VRLLGQALAGKTLTGSNWFCAWIGHQAIERQRVVLGLDTLQMGSVKAVKAVKQVLY